MTLKMALLGSGIQKSRMPRLQQFLGNLSGIPIDYGLIDGNNFSAFDPVATVEKLSVNGHHGLNITHPYKQRIHHLAKHPIIENHGEIGSYNTLKFEDGKIFGANTDFSGFVQGYRFRRADLAPGRVLLCGAGGVGRAIAFGLMELSASHISIFDVVDEQARSLADALHRHGISVDVVSADKLERTMMGADGLVNCTALGMYSHPGSVFPEQFIGPQQWAFDAVYTPLETEFIRTCRENDIQCLSGFDLWIFQGLDAFRIFTGVEVNPNLALFETALSWLD